MHVEVIAGGEGVRRTTHVRPGMTSVPLLAVVPLTGGMGWLQIGRLIAINMVIVVGWSLLVGATAPRWPDRWLDRDRGPLRLTQWDRSTVYRRIGAVRLSKLVPDGGTWFGGRSKDAVPRRDPDALRRFLRESRRAEWVHLLSLLGWLFLPWFNPWSLSLIFAVAVLLANLPSLVIVRHNRLRVTRMLHRISPPPLDPGSASIRR